MQLVVDTHVWRENNVHTPVLFSTQHQQVAKKILDSARASRNKEATPMPRGKLGSTHQTRRVADGNTEMRTLAALSVFFSRVRPGSQILDAGVKMEVFEDRAGTGAETLA